MRSGRVAHLDRRRGGNLSDGGLGLVRGPWNAAVTGGRRTDSQPGQPDTDDTFVQLSGGYDFENGIGVQAGWLRIDQAGLVTQTVGGLVSYGIEF